MRHPVHIHCWAMVMLSVVQSSPVFQCGVCHPVQHRAVLGEELLLLNKPQLGGAVDVGGEVTLGKAGKISFVGHERRERRERERERDERDLLASSVFSGLSKSDIRFTASTSDISEERIKSCEVD